MATVFVCVCGCAVVRVAGMRTLAHLVNTHALKEHLKYTSLLIVFQTIRYSPDVHAGMSHVQASLIADTRLCMFRMHLLVV